ncbi:hypothetical protein CPB83DRAFT_863488 [Crepidotus variabilis]|uniref:F-box domain-containing protein n=1 Tax=Crepidotus variabilis TaxID=179855 RepID=A0A9P6JJS6_9AGAR|nr:hypothetical protein CPB83DRAFT_863488 [Crepidotus variabilis]
MSEASTSSTRRLTRKDTSSSKIDDYFEKQTPKQRTTSSISRHTSETSIGSSTGLSSSPASTSINEDGSQTDDGDTTINVSSIDDAETKKAILRDNTPNNGSQISMTPTRRKKRVKCTSELASDDDSNPKSTARRKAKSRAKLGLLPSLPLDILFEIFTHLMPIDVLHLTRTTKAFRTLLLHRSSTGLWKDCLARVPSVPPYPSDMSLPSLVSLAFDIHCQNCGTKNASKCVDFVLRVRLCGKCTKSELSSQKKYDKQDKQDAIILRAVPFSDFEGWGEKFCSKATRDKFLLALSDHEGDRTTFINEYCERNKANAENAVLWHKWYSDQIDERESNLQDVRASRKEFVQDKLKALGYDKEVEYLGNLESRYPSGCSILPNPYIKLLRDHLHVKPAKKLTEKGWSNISAEMVSYISSIREYRIQDARCLILQARRARASQAYISIRLLPEIVKACPANTFIPGVADFLLWDEVNNLIEKPGDEALVSKDFKPIIDGFTSFVAIFRSAIAIDLIELAKKSNIFIRAGTLGSCIAPSLDSSLELLKNLDLAIIVFRCIYYTHHEFNRRWLVDEGILLPGQPIDLATPELREPCMWYPEFLHHPCCTMTRRNWDERRAGEYTYLKIDNLYRDFRRDPWDVKKKLTFDEKASKTVRNLLAACKMDPATTTAARLDQVNRRFVCLKCTFGIKCDGERSVRVWSWRDAVQHSLKIHFGDAQVKWECISLEYTSKACNLEVTERVVRGYLKPEHQKVWKCVACRDRTFEVGRMSWQGLQTHFMHNPTHGDSNAMDGKENERYYKAEGYIARERPPVRMIPMEVEA